MLRFIALTAIVVATGAVVFRWAVVPRAGLGRALDAPLGTLASSAAALLILVTIPRVWQEAAALSLDPADTWGMVPRVLTMPWGIGAIGQVCGAAVLIAGAQLARRRSPVAGWVIAADAALVLAATPAIMGHANAVEGHRALSLTLDIIHVVAASAWVGGLVPLALVARSGEADAAAALIRSFHAVALTAAAAVAATGVAAVFVRFGGIGPLLHARYGAILAVKLVLVAVVLWFGAGHYRSGERAAAAGTVVRSLARECAFACAVLVATAILIATDPPTVG